MTENTIPIVFHPATAELEALRESYKELRIMDATLHTAKVVPPCATIVDGKLNIPVTSPDRQAEARKCPHCGQPWPEEPVW